MTRLDGTVILLVGSSDDRIVHDQEIASTIYAEEVVQEFLGFWVQGKSWTIDSASVDDSECAVKLAGISEGTERTYHFRR